MENIFLAKQKTQRTFTENVFLLIVAARNRLNANSSRYRVKFDPSMWKLRLADSLYSDWKKNFMSNLSKNQFFILFKKYASTAHMQK